MAYDDILVRPWLARIVLAAAMWLTAASTQAATWQSFRLAEAVVEAPADWTATYSQKDREIRLASPDQNYQLLAFWWFPDEPLLGYDDIVSHERIVVAGHPALLIHSEYPELGVLNLAFEEPRDDDRVLVVKLEFADRDHGKASVVMKDIMSRIRFGDGGDGGGQQGQADQQAPAAPGGQDGSFERYSDDEGGFSISHSADWSRNTATRKGTRMVVVEAPLGAGLVLVASFSAEDTFALSGRLDEYERLYYEEYVITESIEADEEIRLGGLEGRAVDVVADVYAVEGTRLAFRKGWSRFFRAEQGQRAYVIAIIHGLDADQALKTSLFAVAESFVAQPGDGDTVSSFPLPSKGGVPTRRLSARFGDDCRDFDLAHFDHPTRDRFGQGAGARLKWIMLCSAYTYPVYGAEFEDDPSGPTDGYFHTLYLDLLAALGDRSYAVVALNEALAIRVGRGIGHDLDVDLDSLDQAEIAQLAGSPDNAAGADFSEDPSRPPEAPNEATMTAEILFDGQMSEFWLPLSTAGGDFSRFARIENGALTVAVPAGNSWGKTGIWSRDTVAMAPSAEDIATVRFGFDANATTSYVLAFGSADNAEEWEAHEVRFAWSGDQDGKSGTASLVVRRQEVWSLQTGPEPPADVALSIRGDGVVRIELPDGRAMEAVLPGPVPSEGYRLYVLAHAPAHGLAARMTLRTITIERTVAAKPGPKAFPDSREQVVLFDGELGRDWLRYTWAGGDFSRHATLTSEGLAVDVPAGNAWGNVGIFSPVPLVWLDEFHGDATVEIIFEIDPETTDGFGLTLARPGYGGAYDNGPGSPSTTYYWYGPKGVDAGRADFHINPHRDGDFDSIELPPAPPAEVRFTLRPGEVSIDATGMEPITQAWDEALEGNGFHIYAHSAVATPDEPARFALKSIRMKRKAATRPAESGPAAGVEPLPVDVVFDGAMNPAWEPAAVAGGNFDAFASFSGGVLEIDVPERSWWGKTGLLSAEPLVLLDQRVHVTPTRIEITLARGQRHNLAAALSGTKSPDMWPDHKAWYTLSYLPEREVWVMGMRHSPYHDWSREIDAEWMATKWDGRLHIDIGLGRTVLSIPGGPAVGGPASVVEGTRLYATVIANPPKENAAAHLALRQVRVGLKTPDGMTAVDRLILAGDEQFDVDAFADALSAAR